MAQISQQLVGDTRWSTILPNPPANIVAFVRDTLAGAGVAGVTQIAIKPQIIRDGIARATLTIPSQSVDQVLNLSGVHGLFLHIAGTSNVVVATASVRPEAPESVSYTHLTLPTKA